MRTKLYSKVCIINCFDTYEHRADLLHEYFKKHGAQVTNAKDIIIELGIHIFMLFHIIKIFLLCGYSHILYWQKIYLMRSRGRIMISFG